MACRDCLGKSAESDVCRNLQEIKTGCIRIARAYDHLLTQAPLSWGGGGAGCQEKSQDAGKALNWRRLGHRGWRLQKYPDIRRFFR